MWFYIFFLSAIVLILLHKQGRISRRVRNLEATLKAMLEDSGTNKSMPGGKAGIGKTSEPGNAGGLNEQENINNPNKPNKPNTAISGLTTSTDEIGGLINKAGVDSLPKERREEATAAATIIDKDKKDAGLIDTKQINNKKPEMAVANPHSFTEKAKGWLFSGNIPARLGVVLSLLGFVALIKYGHTHGYFRITPAMSMFGLAVASMATSLFGWIKRTDKPTFGRALQGGGVAALTLVIFASYRMYDLLSAEMSMILVALVTAWAVIAALKQNSKWLAALGFLGGYLAPVALSGGSGNPVPLFSLYVILNTAVAIIAYKRDWRLLNMMGFLFTFIIGYSWASKYYKPELFSTVEPFILIFFLIYILIPLFDKTPIAAKSDEDFTDKNIVRRVSAFIVFGMPLLFAPIQMHMFGNESTSNSVICLLLTAIYYGLYQFKKNDNDVLAKSFLVLSFIFASISIPMMFDGAAVMAAWAAEGAAIIWLGRKQSNEWNPLVAIAGGSVLLALAGTTLLTVMYDKNAYDAGSMYVVFNHIFISKLILGVAAIISAYNVYKLLNNNKASHAVADNNSGDVADAVNAKVNADINVSNNTSHHDKNNAIKPAGIKPGARDGRNDFWVLHFFGGCFALMAAVIGELTLIMDNAIHPWHKEYAFATIAASISLFVFTMMNRRTENDWVGWRIGSYLSSILIFISTINLCFNKASLINPISVSTLFAIFVVLGYGRYSSINNNKFNKENNTIILYPIISSVILLLSVYMYVAFKQFDGIRTAMAAVPMMIASIIIITKPELIFKWFGERQEITEKDSIDTNINININNIDDKFASCGVFKNIITTIYNSGKKYDKLLFSMLSLLALMAMSMIGDSGKYNFIYLPILNPVDLMLIAIFSICLLVTITKTADKFKNKDNYKLFFYGAGLIVIGNISIRFVHNALGVPWDNIMSTAQAQTALTLTMAATSVATLIYGSKKLQAKSWYAGAALMGAVVCKLLFVDSSYMSAVSGIVSFIATGGLLVFVGYFAPRPPNTNDDEKQLMGD